MAKNVSISKTYFIKTHGLYDDITPVRTWVSSENTGVEETEETEFRGRGWKSLKPILVEILSPKTMNAASCGKRASKWLNVKLRPTANSEEKCDQVLLSRYARTPQWPMG